MVRLPLLILRWRIKLRSDVERSGQYFLSFWHWSANWKWLELGIIGLFAGALAVHEYSLALAFALGAVFSAFSKLWHWKIYISLKTFGSLFIILLFLYLGAITMQEKEDRPWSNLSILWQRFVVLEKISILVESPHYPPDLSTFPLTSMPISISKAKPIQKRPIEPPSIVVAPSFGDLKDRANKLSDEIMLNLYRHGWSIPGGQKIDSSLLIEQFPATPADYPAWIKRRSDYFRARFYEKVLDMRIEFTELHYRDEQLDDLLKMQAMLNVVNEKLVLMGQKDTFPMTPYDINEVADRLKVLASKIK